MSKKKNITIKENFIKDILKQSFHDNYNEIYHESLLLQYLDLKSKAIHGNVKSRRSLGNIYAIYAILYFYIEQGFYNSPNDYKKFEGFEYIKLFTFYRGLYGGEKLQNHSLNSRVNGEFQTKFATDKILIYRNNSKYLIPINFLYVKNNDISKVCIQIIKTYIDLLKEKDNHLINTLENLKIMIQKEDKVKCLLELLTGDTEARIFEIISYAILKNHYKNTKIYIGMSKNNLDEQFLTLYKTGRTNANDGGIDFVMKPVGRFFQVTEVGCYDKYFLDIDKVMHYPMTFVVKTEKPKQSIQREFDLYIDEKSGGMDVIKERYRSAIEEIITINELKEFLYKLDENQINDVIYDINEYYKLEMNIE